jgi:hypothetical protein
MLIKVALSVAIVLSTASGVLAATKHPIQPHHGPVVQNQVPAGAYGAYGSANRSGESGAVLIQDRDASFSYSNNPYCGGRC